MYTVVERSKTVNYWFGQLGLLREAVRAPKEGGGFCRLGGIGRHAPVGRGLVVRTILVSSDGMYGQPCPGSVVVSIQLKFFPI